MSETKHIWEQFSTSLKRYILSFVKEDTIADDLLQETFVKIHLNSDKIKKQESLKSWIYTIARNIVMDHFKKESKTINKDLFDDYEEEEPANQPHTHKDCLIPLIKDLPVIYKEAVMLSEINGLKQAEVAKQLGISLSGAKSRIQRGREMLKQGFVACCQFKINEAGFLFGEEKPKDDCNVCKD